MTRVRRVQAALATTTLLLYLLQIGPQILAGDTGKHVRSEFNTQDSDLMSRLHLRETAGFEHGTGQYFVKLFVVPRGEECDVDGTLCEGRDLFISVSSPDLGGDHALSRISGMQDWDFVKWRSFAEYDAPEYFTSFDVTITMRPGQMLSECKGARPGGSRTVSFRVSPWKLTCEYR